MFIADSSQCASIKVVFKISEGKVVENRAIPDVLGMMRQIGAIPEPGQSEEASRT
jgi:hypothetical protein